MAATATAKGRVAAGAQGGTAAVNAYDEGQTQIRQNRNQAINQMNAESAQVGAPGALTAQLNAQLQGGAGVALNNLASLGAVDAGNRASENQAANVYQLQAAQALPVITAQDNRDLGQQLAMLDAQRAHSGGGGGGRSRGLAGMSDSEIRNRLIGAAIAQRQSNLGQAQAAFTSAMNAQPETPTPVPFTAAQRANLGPGGGGNNGESLSGRGSFDDSGPMNALLAMHMARENAIHNTIQRVDEPIKRAYFTFKNASYGPGLSNEAALIGMQNGLDPATAIGLTSNADSQYVAENTKQGLYTPPGKSVGVTGQIASPYQVGAQGLLPSGEKLTKQQVDQSMGQKYFDWNGDSTLNSAFAKWAAASPDAQNLSPQAQQQAFEKDPQNQRFARPVVTDIAGNLQSAAEHGWSIDAAWQRIQEDPAFRNYPREYALALSMAAPLFQYYAALRTKMTSPDATAAAGYTDPTAVDPNAAATPTGY